MLVLVVDKDGDAILPLGIKVPRRQLIDYHEDLYPEIAGTSESPHDHMNNSGGCEWEGADIGSTGAGRKAVVGRR